LGRRQIACLVGVLLVGPSTLINAAEECDKRVPRYATRIRLTQACAVYSAAVTPVVSVSAAAPAPESLADAPSHVRELSELAAIQPGPLHAAGYSHNAGAAHNFVNAMPASAQASYRPLTPGQKLNIFFESTYSPYTFLSAAFDAGLAQAEGDSRGYGGGMQGYGKRYGAALANTETSIFFSKFLFPWIFKQDPRYFRMQEGPIAKRGLYAISRIVVTRTDSGGSAFNASRVFGRLAAKAISNSYIPPERRGVWTTLRRTRDCLISDAAMSLAREFWPDIRDKILGKRVPKPMTDIADRVVSGK
jgi:hypothetical protein